MPEEEHDRACMHCGEILSGPNAGEHVPPANAEIKLPEGQHFLEHKGRKITHCGGHGCQEEMEADLAWYQQLAERQEAKKASKRHKFPEMPDEEIIKRAPKIKPRVNPALQQQLSLDRSRQNAMRKLSEWQRKHSTKE